jgi:hypothetical protein
MAPYIGDIEKLRDQLESWGESQVRALLTARRFGEGDAPERAIVEDWLREKEALRDSESVLIARKALMIAIIAIVLSTITASVQAKDQIIWVLQKLGLLSP